MRWPAWGLAGLVALAGLAFWLLLAGPDRLFGLDTGNVGIALTALVAWSALHGVSVAPRSEMENAVSPGEWKAWVGVGFSALGIAYFLSKAHLFAGATDLRDVQAVGRNLVLMLIAWTVLGWLLENRWKGRVQKDERDREIENDASGWGRGALVFVVIGVAVMLGLSPARKLEWATPIAVSNLLVFALIWSCFVEYVVTALSYWRDRR
ncbi:hypothetical protein [Arenimonas sp.]|uniref:hypothetical protein n=1 Tax=Arenimonas sp. TaxID=1872635 RepID=UPI0039E33762